MEVVANYYYPNDKIDGLSTVVNLALRDTSVVAYPVAATAWLTTEGFRWHLLQDILVARTPEDLSYGLVLDYYEPIMQSSLFFLGYETPWAQKITEEHKEKAMTASKVQVEQFTKTVSYPTCVTIDVLNAPTYSPICPICNSSASQ
ncbi:hypothetical protein VZH09_13845 (plasmid) [Synechococcus elongatus IITB7]|uniref:hypothetical protein n=1 Tax=Synechococcus elongatus TaxID=32046 RepID=UPI0030CC0A10